MKLHWSMVRWAVLPLALESGAACADQLPSYTAPAGAVAPTAPATFKLADRLTSAKAVLLQKPSDAEREQLKQNNANRQDKALQIGMPRAVPAAAAAAVQAAALNWQSVPGGGQAAIFTVNSPGAAALRLGLAVSKMPKGAELRVAGSDEPAAVRGPVSAERIMRFARYWTPVVQGETVTVEIYLPPGSAPRDAVFTLTGVSHLVSSPVKPDYSALDNASTLAACSLELDAVCYFDNPAIRTAAAAVAMMEYTDDTGAGYQCTGTLLNSQTLNAPYFWTAEHCMTDNTTANTLNTYWFYQSASCNSIVLDPTYQILFDGALLLYNDVINDGALLRLNDAAPAGATFSGWDSTSIPVSTAMIGIHHPYGAVDRISFGNFTGLGTFNGEGSYNLVTYTSGLTEPGSSGSGLLTQNSATGQYVLRGGLKGNNTSCSNPNGYNVYSRFDLAYPSIQQWLSNTVAPANIVSATVQGISAVSATLTVTANAATTGHFVVLPSTAPAPGTSQVLTGSDSFGAPANSGQWAIQANVAATVDLSGLAANTSYHVYFAAEDVNGGISNVQSLAFSTLASALTQTNVRTYVPFADASNGYQSFIRVANTGATASPITVARIDPQSGQVQASGQLATSLRSGAAITFTAQQVEAALGVSLAASRCNPFCCSRAAHSMKCRPRKADRA